MIIMGPVSSIFDYLTFFLLLFVFLPMLPAFVPELQRQNLFQTAWFVESLTTQALVVFVLRTRKTPFYKSKPGKYLLISTLAVVAVAFALPYTSLGSVFGFSPPPAMFYLALVGIIAIYLFLVEVVKKWFNKRYAYLLEQSFVPKKPKLAVQKTN